MASAQNIILPENYRFRPVDYELATRPLYEKLESVEAFIERLESLIADAEDVCPHRLTRFNFILAGLKSERDEISDEIDGI